jgi:hypothetical protein
MSNTAIGSATLKWMVDLEWELHDAMAQTNPFGVRSQICEDDFRGRAEAITGQKVMLDKPCCAVTELVGQYDLLDGFIVGAPHPGAADVDGLDFVKDAQIDAPFSWLQSPSTTTDQPASL